MNLLLLRPEDNTLAVEFIVDRVDDDASFTQCSPGVNLDCTLRGAVIAANLTPGAPHTVTLPAGTYTLTLDSCTLVGNVAAFSPAIDPGSPLTLTNNVIEGGCGLGGEESPLGGPLSEGGNVESPGDSCGLSGAIDTVNVPDLGLGPLADFGGLTRTHLPYPSSPVVGAGNDVLCSAADQRGEPRGDGDCDSGAVERQVDDPSDPTVVFIDGFESGNTSAWFETSP